MANKKWFHHSLHRNSLARLEKMQSGWNLRFYWMQYTSGSLQREASNNIMLFQKEWYVTEKECLDLLAKLNYIKSERQDYHA